MATWKLKSCPRCTGDLYVNRDKDGWNMWCLQCGYEDDLPDRVKVDQTVGGSQKDEFSRLLDDLSYVAVEDY